MTLHVEWTDEELPELQHVLNRALNTWDPRSVPKWIFDLEARINDLKTKKEEVRRNARP